MIRVRARTNQSNRVQLVTRRGCWRARVGQVSSWGCVYVGGAKARHGCRKGFSGGAITRSRGLEAVVHNYVTMG